MGGQKRMTETRMADETTRSTAAQQRAAEWLAAARAMVGEGADEALHAALVNAMASAYLADAVHEAGGSVFDLVTDLPGLKSALRG